MHIRTLLCCGSDPSVLQVTVFCQNRCLSCVCAEHAASCSWPQDGLGGPSHAAVDSRFRLRRRHHRGITADHVYRCSALAAVAIRRHPAKGCRA